MVSGYFCGRKAMVFIVYKIRLFYSFFTSVGLEYYGIHV
jgi:hypothetical protein